MLDDLGLLQVHRIQPLQNDTMNNNNNQYSNKKNTDDIDKSEFEQILEPEIKNYKNDHM